MKKSYNIRALTAEVLMQVLDEGVSLSAALPAAQQQVDAKDNGLLHELCYGILRTLPQLEALLSKLLQKPLKGKLRTLHYLLLTGLYQILYTRIPPHAAVAETVEGVIALKKPKMKGLINGVLREFLRQKDTLLAQSQPEAVRYAHPSWLLKRIQTAYPKEWKAIVENNNQKPPIWLRVNPKFHTAQEYLQKLIEQDMIAEFDPTFPQALRLTQFYPVSSLPGFEQGWVTIQDISAQGASLLLDPQNGESILDLCAAPGGKTTHILELAPTAKVLAVDVDAQRLTRVKENLARLQQDADVRAGDACHPEQWADGQQFDRILIDVPCSATGVIRRHPDIKWLRRDSDIATLVETQHQILAAIWDYLKPNGTLVYTTCSILPEENQHQISAFLAAHPEAKLAEPVKQVLPTADGGDGFFYAKIQKTA